MITELSAQTIAAISIASCLELDDHLIRESADNLRTFVRSYHKFFIPRLLRFLFTRRRNLKPSAKLICFDGRDRRVTMQRELSNGWGLARNDRRNEWPTLHQPMTKE